MTFPVQLVQYGRQQTVARLTQGGAGLRKHKCASAKCCFGLANCKTALPDGRGLLVTGHAANANCTAEMFWQCCAKVSGTIGDLWQNVARDTE